MFSVLTAPFAWLSLVRESVHPPSSVFAVLTTTPLSLLVSHFHQLEGSGLLQPSHFFQASFVERCIRHTRDHRQPRSTPKQDMAVNHPTSAYQPALQSPGSIDLLSSPIAPHF
ncbi:hypothetical protein K443DRAFT_12147 [Laccaria amethystina LaAM-08-1]|uniref:Uncharacterized protein n=1 Tax=Laccaria amethystina LaAM-08-1 TaxID=1095629 RepID=A0A0C9XE29_9AGAR|nr:hypothetical protein K443DRAFT_12147 [Laccaria amethystina LaAM-08-1]